MYSGERGWGRGAWFLACGATSSQLPHNFFKLNPNAPQILRHSKPIDPQYLKTLRSNVRISPRIPLKPFLCWMIFPINLQIQHQFQTYEVQCVWSHRMFASKLFAQQSMRANELPNIPRKFIGLAPLVASEFDTFGLSSRLRLMVI